MPAPSLAAAPGFPAELLPTLLEVSLAALLLLRPVYAPGSEEVVDFAVEYLSPAAQRILRQPERPGGTMLTHFPHVGQAGVLAFYCRAFASGRAERYNTHYQHDGFDSYFYVAAQRHGSWLLVSFTDTAEQPRSAIEEALRASQVRERTAWVEGQRERQRLLALITQAPVLVAILFGPTHQIELANDHFRRALGNRPLVGRTYREAVPELAGQRIFARLDEVYQTGEPFRASELPLHLDRTNSGQLAAVYYDLLYQAMREADGQVSGVFIIATEVTALVLARQQVQELNQELAAAVEQLRASNTDLEYQVADRTHALLVTLQQLEQRRRELAQALAAEQELGELKSRFVSMASHEFRTPLTTVLASAELVADYPAADQQPQRLRHIGHIRAAVGQLTDLLEEFLSVGRIEAGQVVARPAPLLPAALLAETVAAVQGLCKPGQTIVAHADCPDPIALDASLLRKILLNLLSNALKYSGPGTTVTVRTHCRDNQLTMSVQDQGVGISAPDLARLFERFFRAASAAEIPGTGLGLYIVARYLELLGGRIDLASELGAGTTFTVTIPYAHAHDSAA